MSSDEAGAPALVANDAGHFVTPVNIIIISHFVTPVNIIIVNIIIISHSVLPENQ